MRKRFPAMILALALCMGLAIPAFAAEPTETELQSSFAIRRNGKYDETKNFYQSSHKGHIVWDSNGKAEDVNFNVMTNGDSWTVTNTGSKALFGGDDYVLRVHRTTCWQNTETDEVYDYTGDANGDWWGSNGWFISDIFAPDEYGDETGYPVNVKRGESVTIPAMAGEYHDEGIIQYKMDGGEVFNGPLYRIEIVAFADGSEKGTTVYSVYLHQDANEVKDKGAPAQADPEPAIESDEPKPVKPAAPAFTDLADGGYYVDAVAWALDNQITNGTSETTFEPDTTCSQIQILTFLYRAAQGDDATATAADMDAAVEWAKEKGMIDDTFVRETDCTRATAVNYIWQAFGKAEAKAVTFADVDADADYAAAVSWALENGVTNGTSMEDNTFGPDETCTRGQIVTFLHRAYVEEARLK